MVDERYYEEKPDPNLVRLLPENLRIEKAGAFRVTRPRLIGDIGLRGFLQLYRKAKKIIKEEQIDFLYIPIPSFYVALLGRWLHATTGVSYGIDYIDPWVHRFPGSDKRFSRHWFSTRLAEWLEPIAIRKASIITGVAEGYYKGVRERNPYLEGVCLFGAMPYGGEEEDHKKLRELGAEPYLFKRQPGRRVLVYAGAMLPKAYGPLEAILQAMSADAGLYADTEIHFIGTGKTPNDPEGYNIKPLAEKYGLWEKTIFEYPARIPYLDVLTHLEAAAGIFVLGSTEAHYTPSKVYQAVLSEKPVFAVLHRLSTAAGVIRDTNAGIVLTFDGEGDIDSIGAGFNTSFREYVYFMDNFSAANVKKQLFGQFSARAVTAQLAGLLDKVEKRSIKC